MSLASLSSRSADPGLQQALWPDRQAVQHVWGLDVLLVDDDAADCSLVLGVLKRHPNVSAAHAMTCAQTALKRLAAGHCRPDLVLLDINMPKIGGFEFLQRMRDIPAAAEVPVVFLTTSGHAKDVFEAKHSSASLYVVKPDTYAGLHSRLDAVIKRARFGAWSE